MDGMSGNSDRGGLAELLSVAKQSKNPIICICNDRQSPKIRSLANSCYDLKVRRPTRQQIACRLVNIAQQEGLHMDMNAAELLVEQSGNDIRQVIHSMQMWKGGGQGKDHGMSYGEVKANISRIEKDKVLRQTPFDACMSILEGGRSKSGQSLVESLDDRYNSFFIGRYHHFFFV